MAVRKRFDEVSIDPPPSCACVEGEGDNGQQLDKKKNDKETHFSCNSIGNTDVCSADNNEDDVFIERVFDLGETEPPDRYRA